jgi:hypothetical protein
MRRLLLALPFALALPAAARPDEVSDLRDRVLKAAAKDPADINKFKGFVLKAKGTARPNEEAVSATLELVAVYPGKVKMTWGFTSGEMKHVHTDCASDDKGWRQATNIPTMDLSVEELNDLRTDVYGVFCWTLLALTEPETKLALGGRSKVGADSVVSLQLTRRPYREVTLLFDEKTYLLRKVSYRGRERGVLMTKELIFDGHKPVGGLTLPMTQKIVVDGKEVYNWTELTFEFPDKLDGKTFEKP